MSRTETDSPTTGDDRRRRAQGSRADALQAILSSTDAQAGEWANGFIFGDVWGRPGMSQDERMVIAIALLGASGQLNLMKNYVHGALQAGIEPRRIHEALVMLVVYNGFPTMLNALYEWRTCLRAAVKQGHVTAEQEAELDRR